MKNLFVRFVKDELGRHRHRVRPHRRRHFGRDHRGRERPWHATLNTKFNTHFDPAEVIGARRIDSKGSGHSPEPFAFAPVNVAALTEPQACAA